MFQKVLQGGSGDGSNNQKVTIIPITKSTWFDGTNYDIKPYCEDYANLTIDNFYGLITYNSWAYGGARNEKTYNWSYDASTGLLKCIRASGGDDYFKIETDIVVVR